MFNQILPFSILILWLLISAKTTLAHSVKDAVVIHLEKDQFNPQKVQVDLGGIVIFENADSEEHWPASNIHPTHQIYPQFDPKKAIKPQESWQFKFDRAGEWGFHDHLKPTLTGRIKVFAKEKRQSFKLNSQTLLSSLKAGLEKIYFRFNPGTFERQFREFNILADIDKKEAEVERFLRLFGYTQVMDKLLADSGYGSRTDCHQQAHYIGRIAYAIDGAKVFKYINPSCHSGFIHGAMEAFLSQKGTENLVDDISKLCNGFNTSFGRFECLHGVGHGILAYHDYDLPAALDDCRRLNSDYERSSCFGGVFMENIITAQGRGGTSHQTAWVNNDPYFPCNSVDQSYLIQEQCYLIQTARMLDLSRYDFSLVINMCLQTPQKLIATCFQSLGRDAASQKLRDPVKIVAICNQVPANYYNRCILGGLNVIIDFWGQAMKDQPNALCNILAEDKNKRYCYKLLGQRLVDVFGSNDDKKRDICRYAQRAYQRDCLVAAGL